MLWEKCGLRFAELPRTCESGMPTVNGRRSTRPKGTSSRCSSIRRRQARSLAALSGPVTTKTVFALNIKRCLLRLKPVIDARYPLAALPAALDHLDRGGFGKIVVEVA